MKKYLLPVLVLTLAIAFILWKAPAKSETHASTVGKPLVSQPIAFGVSTELRATPAAKDAARMGLRVREVGGPDSLKTDGEIKSRSTDSLTRETDVTHDSDESIATIGDAPMPSPLVNVPGLANQDNAEIYQLLILPADMNGDVGPNHYVQIVNSLIRVFNKSGQPVSPPFRISSLFMSLGTVCSTRNDGLAVVQYDQLADRWLITQTCVAFPPFRQMVAVSHTGDPLGAYHAYEYVMPNVKLNDFPKFGIWPDAYYMSTDEFLGGDYVGAGAFAFDRAKLLAGDPTASFIYFNLQVPIQPRQKGLLPADLDGLRPPPAGSPGVFASYIATEYGDAQDAIRLYDFHANFTEPLLSVFVERPESPIAVAAFDPTSPDGRPDIAQPPPGEFLDSQSDRLNYRLAYRNFGTHESLVVNQTVRTTPVSTTYRAGVRIYEFQKTSGPYSVVEQATIGSQTASRWIASAAQDNQGNLAVQYNHASENKKPSVNYTGRLASEPAGAFRTEASLVEGTGVQRAFGWRWGEYSGMNVDPEDDCTFWMTNGYYTLESEIFSDFGWVTRIGSFKFAECTPAPRGNITGLVTNSVTSQPVAGAVVRASAYSRATNAAGSYGALAVLPGTYQLTASARGYLPQSVVVTVTNGETLTRNFDLTPVPIIENTAMQLTAESCSINGAPEPGETVTLNVSLRNTGVLNAASLNATLLSTGGVVSPSPAANYGSMPPGGPAVARPFTFTILPSASCGSIVTLSFELRDGSLLVGNITIPLQTGVQRVAMQENFDGVAAPALPVGWSTTSSENHQLWRTSSTRNQTVPNSLFSPAPHQMGVNEVISPPFNVVSGQAEINFRNWYELETTFLRNRLYDGSVLEIKLGEGDWQDILAAGGLFLSGGYDGRIDACCMNPLAGRLGWSGRSGVNQTSEFINTRAKLPAIASGQTVRLRFRVGTDIGTFREGQYIDNLVVTDGFTCACAAGRPAPFDFDGDGKTDLSVYDLNAGGGDYRVIRSLNGVETSVSWGTTGDMPANADLDGDGKTDFVVYRPSEGIWYTLRSSDGAFVATRFGLAGDTVVPADYDGDGRADIAVWRSSTRVWYMLRSSDGQATGYQFGLEGDRPVRGDFDGDGKFDIAVWRPSTGVWYVARSSDAGFTIVPFGLNGDIPVSGDHDGDGRADLAVFRSSDRIWYVLRSTAGFFATQFGLAGDMPLQTDFDGDGRAEIALFRPSSRTWFYLRSSDGQFIARGFGSGSEQPVPGIYVR